jgi:hypothetical protein
MPRNRLPRVMKHYSPTGKRNYGRPLKRLLDTWDQNGSTSGPTPWLLMMIWNTVTLRFDTHMWGVHAHMKSCGSVTSLAQRMSVSVLESLNVFLCCCCMSIGCKLFAVACGYKTFAMVSVVICNRETRQAMYM